MLFAGVIYIRLPNYPKSPRSQKWLTPREQECIEARISENAPITSDPAFNKAEHWVGLTDVRTYTFGLQLLLFNFSTYAINWQLPTVVTVLAS
jgi:hypothetical protein